MGIIFLAFELDHANRIGEYSAENARRNQWISINKSTLEYAGLFTKLNAGEELTPKEQHEALSFARMFSNAWGDAEAAYTQGLLSEATFQTTLQDIAATFSETPGIVPHLAYLAHAYPITDGSSRVQIEMDRLLEEAGYSLE